MPKFRPEPGTSTTGPSYIAPGSGRVMRAPAMCAFGDGAFDVDPERADVGIGPYEKTGSAPVGAAISRPTRSPSPAEHRQPQRL